MASKVANSPAERKLAYAILHRHGHRAPARNLGPEAEALRWQAFLAPHDELYRYKEKYKVKLHPSNPVARDMSAPPFGALTSKGFQHMVGVGRSIAQQFPALASPRSVTTFATNYNRTQLSAQAVLAGLDYPACDVTVRHVPSCALSMQERNPALAATVRKRIHGTREFQYMLDASAGLRAQLVRHLPKLAEHEHGFDWFAAFDYFTCHDGHGVPIPAELRALEPGVLGHVVNRYRLYNSDDEHSQIFSKPILRDVWSCLSEGLQQQRRPTESSSSSSTSSSSGNSSSAVSQSLERPPVSIFSCHDTTVLAVLYLMKHIGFDTGPDAFYDDGVLTQQQQEKDAISWPGFGTTIVFELVERSGEAGAAPQHVVNMHYNLKPLRFLNKSYTDLETVPPPDVLVSDDDPYIIKMDLAAGNPPSASLSPDAQRPPSTTSLASATSGGSVGMRAGGAHRGKHIVHHGITVEQFQELMK